MSDQNMMNQTISKISLYSLLSFATMANASGQNVPPASTVASDAGSDEQSTSMIATVQRAIVDRTNEFRKSKQLADVQRDEHLMQAAKEFAAFMAETGKYGHQANDMTPAERAEAAGYNYCVVRENIAYRMNTGEVTADSLSKVFVQGWIDSPPHRENMLADYITHMGVAVATTDDVTYYAVQMFGRPKSAAFSFKLNNESGETKTIVFRANDQKDEVELQPRMILTMTRCFPTKVSVAGSETFTLIDSSTNFNVTDDGLVQQSSD